MPRPKQKVRAHRALTRKQIGAILSKQRAQDVIARKVKQAAKALSHFRPRKSDRGAYVFIGIKGNRSPQSKGKKGYLVYVTKSGRKKRVPEYGEKVSIPRKISDFNIKSNKSLHKAQGDFNLRRRVLLTSGRAQVKGAGAVNSQNQYDFSDKIVKEIARNIRDTLQGQRSKRSFIINSKVLVDLGDQTEVLSFSIPIARADHIAIKLAGVENFVSQKFYAFMAQELAYSGYVSSGSANHIRSLPQNKGKSRSKWTDRNGEDWKGREKEQVRIKRIQWTIEQVQ